MTVKEMLEKVNAYNEVNEVLGINYRQVKLVVEISGMYHHDVTNMREFKKLMNDEYVLADELLGYKFYEFGEVAELTNGDITSTAEFNIYSV